jgi:hypothetical protein
MDTLTIIREIIDLAAERDAFRNRLSVANDEIRAYQADSLRLQSRVTTQANLIDELHAALDDARAQPDTWGASYFADLRITLGLPQHPEPSWPEMIGTVSKLVSADKRAPTGATSQSEQTHMSREEILSVAREALEKGWEVRVLMSDGQTHVTHIREIDDSKLPIRFDDDSCELTWEYLACEAGPALEGGIPKVSRLELL